ncbi:MAG: VIT1/CCC1 transporter family protein [Patescibacteria group bacterium]|nr:VIT1/CCC1 transporter family protein [Patescibacteria group bacterium]
MNEVYVRNIVFGIADSLVSTVGLLAGIDVSGTTRIAIITTGLIYAFVEAFSMAVGGYLSEQCTLEYKAQKSIFHKGPYVAALVMFVSFVLASLIPILPYIIFGLSSALYISIAFSILALFFVGIAMAKISNVSLISRGIRMVVLGGAAILIGILVGKFA